VHAINIPKELKAKSKPLATPISRQKFLWTTMNKMSGTECIKGNRMSWRSVVSMKRYQTVCFPANIDYSPYINEKVKVTGIYHHLCINVKTLELDVV
jgi:hypothetical protein